MAESVRIKSESETTCCKKGVCFTLKKRNEANTVIRKLRWNHGQRSSLGSFIELRGVFYYNIKKRNPKGVFL